MNVEFRESFTKDLRAVTDKPLLRRVRELIEAVEKAQNLGEVGDLKKLKGGGNYFRVRVGDYRVGLRIERKVISNLLPFPQSKRDLQILPVKSNLSVLLKP